MMSFPLVGTTRFEPRSTAPKEQRLGFKKWQGLKKEKAHRKTMSFLLVGTTRFELATPRPPAECSTGLSHVPIW